MDNIKTIMIREPKSRKRLDLVVSSTNVDSIQSELQSIWSPKIWQLVNHALQVWWCSMVDKPIHNRESEEDHWTFSEQLWMKNMECNISKTLYLVIFTVSPWQPSVELINIEILELNRRGQHFMILCYCFCASSYTINIIKFHQKNIIPKTYSPKPWEKKM